MNFVLPEPDHVEQEHPTSTRPPEQQPNPLPANQELEQPNHFGHKPFGGFVVLGKDQIELDAQGLVALTTRQPYIVSYCIGDFVAPDRYEIVTGMSQHRVIAHIF